MKVFFGLMIVFFSLCFAVFSQCSDYSNKNESKGKIKQVKYFERNFWGPDDNREMGNLNLSGLNIFDKKGRLLEGYLISNSTNGSYFERRVYQYDSKNILSSIKYYRSAKTQQHQTFRVENIHDTAFAENLIKSLEQNFTKETTCKYNKNKRLVESKTTDVRGKILSSFTVSYTKEDLKSEFVSFEDYRKINLRIVSTRNAKRNFLESIRYENDIATYKTLTYYDKKGRSLREEQYWLKTLDSKQEKEEILRSLSISKYENNDEVLDWFIYNEFGFPTTKLHIIGKNDEEVLREEYANVSTSKSPEWQLKRIETREYKFDAKGNWVENTWFLQEDLKRPSKITLIMERLIEYY